MVPINQTVLSVGPKGAWVKQNPYNAPSKNVIFSTIAAEFLLKTALHSHGVTMLIPWLMLTHTGIVQQHRLSVLVTEHWEFKHRTAMQLKLTATFLGIKWTSVVSL